MCLGVPAQIVETHGPGRATVAMSGVTREISTDLLIEEAPTIGDWVLVHVGFALSVIDEAEAAETLRQIEKLGGGVLSSEIDSFATSKISSEQKTNAPQETKAPQKTNAPAGEAK